METEVKEVNLQWVCQAIFGISSMRYRQLANEGKVAPVLKGGKVQLLPAVRSLLDYFREQIKKGESATLQSERKKKVEIERRIKELKLMLREGELIPRSDLSGLISERKTMVERGLNSLYRVLVKRLPGKDQREMSLIIETEVRKLLNKFAEQKRPRKSKGSAK